MHKKLKIQGFFSKPEIGQDLTITLQGEFDGICFSGDLKTACFIDDSTEALEFRDLKRILVDHGACDDDIQGVADLFEFYDLWRLANY